MSLWPFYIESSSKGMECLRLNNFYALQLSYSRFKNNFSRAYTEVGSEVPQRTSEAGHELCFKFWNFKTNFYLKPHHIPLASSPSQIGLEQRTIGIANIIRNFVDWETVEAK